MKRQRKPLKCRTQYTNGKCFLHFNSYDNKFFQLLFVFCHKLLWKLKKNKFTGVDLDTRLKLLLQQESHINLFPFFFLKLNQKVCLIQISHTIPSGKWRNSFESNSSHVLDFAMPCCFAVGSGLLYFNAGSSKKKLLLNILLD